MVNRVVHNSIFWYIIPGLYSLYYFQGVLYDRGPLSLIAISLLLVFGLFFCFKTFIIDSRRPAPLKIILFFIVLVTISFIISPKYVHSRNTPFPLKTFDQYKELLLFFLSIFTGYQIGLKKLLASRQLLFCCAVFMGLAVLYYIRLHLILHESIQRDEITNNSAYFFVSILPYFVLLLKYKKWLGWFLILISLCFIVSSFKRGAIVISAAVLLYISVYGNSKNRISFKSILFATATMCIAVVLFLDFMDSSAFMTERVADTMEGNSSARDRLYANLWEHFLNSDLLHQLFGYGISQTVTFAENYAHNDWLEILTNYGLLGVALYASILYSLVRYRKYLSFDKPSRLCYTIIMISWILKTLFSMGIGITSSINIVLLGYLIGYSVQYRKRLHNLL